jgi:hypothetical protein
MKSAVLAATDLVFNTSKERFYYPKAALIQLEVGTDQDVYVIHHRLAETELEGGEKGNTVVSTNLRVVRKEDLSFILDSIIFESQLSSAINFRDVTLENALLAERLTPAMLSRYLTDATTPLEKSYVRERVQYLRLPIRTQHQTLSAKEKIAVLREFDPIEARDIKSQDILSVDARARGNVNETGYVVAMDALLENTNADLLGYLEARLTEGLPQEWRIRRTKESRLRIETKGARPAALSTFLSILPVKTSVQPISHDGDIHYEVAISQPEPSSVVETFYTRDVAYPKYVTLEDSGDKPEEGDPCKTEDGKSGVLKKQGDSLVCMVKESYTPNFREEVKEGDPCEDKDGTKGTMRLVNGALVCVVKESRITRFDVADSSALREGDAYSKDGVTGKIVRDENGKLIGQVIEFVDREAFRAPFVKEAEFGGDSEGSNGASPAPGDICAVGNEAGTLKLINGALICAIGNDLPNGAEGAN